MSTAELIRALRAAREPAGRAPPASRPLGDTDRAKLAAGLAKLGRRLGRKTKSPRTGD